MQLKKAILPNRGLFMYKIKEKHVFERFHTFVYILPFLIDCFISAKHTILVMFLRNFPFCRLVKKIYMLDLNRL